MGQANPSATTKHGDPGCTCTTCHIAKRRSHKKSRNGCKNCKRRRIKCDEVKPGCGQCAKALITCGYATATTPPNPQRDSDAPAEADAAKIVLRKGRPRKDWDAIFTHPSPAASSTSPNTADSDLASMHSMACDPVMPIHSPQTLPTNPMWIWTADDLEIQHHYMISADICPPGSKLWRTKVPRLGFTNHCVLHLLLAVSALHLARERPDEAGRYEVIADGHYAVGLQQVMEILPNLNRDNCGALYIATTLVCSYSFAQSPSPGHLLIVSDGNQVAWLELLKGVRIVVETMGFDAIFSGVLGPGPSSEPEPEQPTLFRTTRRVVGWEPYLKSVSGLLSAVSESDKSVYEKMLEGVFECLRETFGTEEEPRQDLNGKMECIIGCLYRTEDAFVQRLKEKQPIALLILAHFVVAIKTLEWLWYMKGWASHVLHGVALMLGPEYGAYLRWPREEINRLNEERDQALSMRKGTAEA